MDQLNGKMRCFYVLGQDKANNSVFGELYLGFLYINKFGSKYSSKCARGDFVLKKRNEKKKAHAMLF